MNYADIKLVKGFTKVVIPFQFETKEHEKKDGKDESKVNYEFKRKLQLDKYTEDGKKYPFRKSELKPNDKLVGGLEDMMKENKGHLSIYETDIKNNDDENGQNENFDSSTIADVYEIKLDNREQFKLSRSKTCKYNYEFKENDRSITVKLTIPIVRIFLFESHAGFLEIEFDFEENTIDYDTYLSTNYSLQRSYHNSAGTFSWEKSVSEGKTETMSFSVEELAKQIFEIMGCVHNIGKHYTKDKVKFDYLPQIFTYGLFDKKPDDIDEFIFKIKKNFKDSYKFPDEKNALNKYTYQMFENSYWGHSLNVSANISFKTGDCRTDAFFSDEHFVKSLATTYYFLYMCVLNQRYGIVIQKGKLSQFDDLNSDEYYTLKASLKKVQKYKIDALKFKYKSFFKVPSAVEHINDYYRHLCASKNIEELYKSFIDDLNSNELVYSTIVKKKNEDKSEMEEVSNCQRDIFLSFIGNLVAFCQLITTAKGFLNTGNKNLDFLINALIVIIFVINFALSVISNVKKIYNIVKDKGVRTGGYTDEDNKKFIKETIEKEFKIHPIIKFFVFRMIDKDFR